MVPQARQAAQLDLVSQGDRAGQFEQGNVAPGKLKRSGAWQLEG